MFMAQHLVWARDVADPDGCAAFARYGLDKRQPVGKITRIMSDQNADARRESEAI
jgi:hypothetical protein